MLCRIFTTPTRKLSKPTIRFKINAFCVQASHSLCISLLHLLRRMKMRTTGVARVHTSTTVRTVPQSKPRGKSPCCNWRRFITPSGEFARAPIAHFVREVTGERRVFLRFPLLLAPAVRCIAPRAASSICVRARSCWHAYLDARTHFPTLFAVTRPQSLCSSTTSFATITPCT